MESHVEQSLRDRILQYLKIAGLKHISAPQGPIYVGPLVVFIGPKGAEVLFRNQSQRYRLSSDPPPSPTPDIANRKSWVEVVSATTDPEEVITYIDNLLNPMGAKTGGTSMPSELEHKGSVYVRSDIALLRLRVGSARDAFLWHGSKCKTCDVWCQLEDRRWKIGDKTASWDPNKLCKKGRILLDTQDHLRNLLREADGGGK